MHQQGTLDVKQLEELYQVPLFDRSTRPPAASRSVVYDATVRSNARSGVPIVAAAAGRFVVIADSSKPVDSLSPPVPLELLAFGLRSTLARLAPEVELRDVPRSPDGGAIADYRGEIGDPAALAARLEADPGISSHGLFPAAMVGEVRVGAGDAVNRLKL